MQTAIRNIPADLIKRYEEAGWWTPDTLGDLVARGLAASPDAGFCVHSAVRPYTGTFRDVELVARRLAAGLRKRGVGPGDVIALQLPNWMEAAATFWASALLGAVVVPIVHFYGRKEIAHIVATVEPRVFVTAEQFGRMAYQPDLCEDVPIVALVGGDGRPRERARFRRPARAPNRCPAPSPPIPAAPALIAFTSGTTRDPKGVIHSHQTLGFETRQLLDNYPPERGRQLTATPVGHFIGMLGAFLIPVLEGAPIDLADVCGPGRGAGTDEVGRHHHRRRSAVLRHQPARPSRLHRRAPQAHQDRRPRRVDGARRGDPTPGRLRRVRVPFLRQHRAPVDHGFECSTPPRTSGSTPTEMPGPASSCKLTDDGEIISRGPDLCLGYTDPELTAKAFDEDGWYHTGDVGVLDDDGYLTITDRKADVIIRGGENISALEVEEVLLAMPQVVEAVVVAAPDARLGERAAAVLRLRAGAAMPTLDEVRAHFEAAGVARQKWPEELHEADDFPRTASGKVQKFRACGKRIATQRR